MADTVRYLMEEMVPELEDMVKQRYFSRQEVKQIVKRRQDFEYLLKRRAALKDDFLSYVEYESKLEELRRHRAKALHPGGKKKSLADYAIVRRIHFIFERAVRKFKTDLSLWTAWLEYCRSSNSNRRLGRVVGRALQIHPTEPGLWVYAASWEFEVNGNPSAARALMQQGLRMCRHSQKMWLDYFDMELMYVEKLLARRRILGLDNAEADGEAATGSSPRQQQQQQLCSKKRQQVEASNDEDDDDMREPAVAAAAVDGEGPVEAEETAAAAAEASENFLLQQQQQGQSSEQPVSAAAADDPQAAVKAVLGGAVARVVFQQAVKAAAPVVKQGQQSAAAVVSEAAGLSFRAGFLEVLGRYKSPGARQLRQEVVDSIKKDFPQSPKAADIIARSLCDPTDLSASEESVQAAVQEYERLLGRGSSSSSAHIEAAAAAAAAASGRLRGSKRQKRAAAPGSTAAGSTAAAAAAVPAPELVHDAVVELYCLYCQYLHDRFLAMTGHEEHVLQAAAAAQQLFKVCLRAHQAEAAAQEVYGRWIDLAEQLQQHKVALRASRLSCEAFPGSLDAWQRRLRLECQPPTFQSSSNSSSDMQVLNLVQQALRLVPAAQAEQLWQQAFQLAATTPSQLPHLQQMLLAAITKAAVKGPGTGGLGAAAAAALMTTWQQQGAEAARQLWKQLLLLPPAGGDMFQVMIQQEVAAAGGSMPAAAAAAEEDATNKHEQQAAASLPADALRRVRALYNAWADAYGAFDADLWVQYALFEQTQSKQGPGKVYWRAVKALLEPDAFIQQYRAVIGLL